MSDNTFVCYICGVEFEKAWTDEDAHRESVLRGDGRDVVPVCNECYQKLAAQWVKEQ